jgi:hypothetical protein
MTKVNSVIAVYDTHDSADDAVRTLGKAGFDMKELSVIGKGFHSEEQVGGFYNMGDRMKFWGKYGAFWGGLIGILLSPALLFIPVVGHIIVFGPIASSIVGGFSGAAVGGGSSALVAGLVSIGIPKDSAIRYETELKADKFLLIVHGDAAQVEKARDLMKNTAASDVSVHEDVAQSA